MGVVHGQSQFYFLFLFLISFIKIAYARPMLERWEDFHEKLLVSCWQKQKKEFRNDRSTKKESKFNTVSKDVMVTGEQCEQKV